MLFTIKKCKKCKGPISESFLSDKGENNYARFLITYCPNCIKLNDIIPVVVMGHTVQQDKPKLKSEPKFKVSKSKKKRLYLKGVRQVLKGLQDE